MIKLPHSFVRIFEKDFHSYNISIQDLVHKLAHTSMISIQHPIVKCKFYIKGISIRWFCVVKNDTIVPLFMVIKNSRLWDNLILDKTMSKKLDHLMWIYTQEISNGLYNMYDL